jgi:predicted aspartyl protease
MKIVDSFLIILIFCPGVRAENFIHVSDAYGFTDALQSGYAKKIDSLVDSVTDPRQKQIFLAGQLRVRANLDGSTLYAAQCYDPTKVVGASQLPMTCGLIVAGNALNNGDVATWAHITGSIKEKVTPEYIEYSNTAITLEEKARNLPLQNTPIKANYTIDIFSYVKDYSSFEQWPYITKVSAPENQSDIIPVVWHGETSQGNSTALPYIQLLIDGKQTEGLLDTGTSGNLVLDKKTARDLGITHITYGWSRLAHLGGREQDSSLGNAQTVTVGSTQFQNVPVAIADTGDVPVTIGLNLLRQLGIVSFSAQQLVISSHAPTSCTAPLAMGAPLAGSAGWVVYPVEVNNNKKYAIIDTGAPMLFYEARDNVTLRHPALGLASSLNPLFSVAPKLSTRSNLNIADTRYLDQPYPVIQGVGTFDYGVGAALLQHNTITMDFRNGHLCINPTNENK